jgi:hypothetical protein
VSWSLERWMHLTRNRTPQPFVHCRYRMCGTTMCRPDSMTPLHGYLVGLGEKGIEENPGILSPLLFDGPDSLVGEQSRPGQHRNPLVEFAAMDPPDRLVVEATIEQFVREHRAEVTSGALRG